MSSNRRYKSPILQRLRSQQKDQQIAKTPNIYTQEFQKSKPSRQQTFRKSIGKSKHKKVYQKALSNETHSDNQRVNLLIKQNSQLRKQIVQLKVQQFYQFDDKKLKQLLIEVESLKKQLKKCKEQLQQAQLQNDYLRRANHQLKSQIQKSHQQTKLYSKKYQQNIQKSGGVSPRIHKEDQELTQRIHKKPIITSSSNGYQEFQDCRLLLQAKSTQKKQRRKKAKDIENQYLLLLQSKNRVMSPRNSSRPYQPTSPRDTKNLLTYKSKRTNINPGQI